MSQPQDQAVMTKLILDNQQLLKEHSALLIQSTNFISFLIAKLDSNVNNDQNKPIDNEPESSQDQTLRGSPEPTEQ